MSSACSSSSDRVLVLIIGGLLACYLVAAAFHLPQHGTELVVAGRPHKAADSTATGNACARRARGVRAIRRTGW